MVRVLVSVVERDTNALGATYTGRAALLEPLEHAFSAAGLCVDDPCVATHADVAYHHSSWAKRLGIPARRPAWTLTAVKR
jgi:hypothetical protein